MVQRRHRHGAGVQAAAELLVADHRQSVGQDGHHVGVLLNIFRIGVAHEAPAVNVPHPGNHGEKVVGHGPAPFQRWKTFYHKGAKQM